MGSGVKKSKKSGNNSKKKKRRKTKEKLNEFEDEQQEQEQNGRICWNESESLQVGLISKSANPNNCCLKHFLANRDWRECDFCFVLQICLSGFCVPSVYSCSSRGIDFYQDDCKTQAFISVCDCIIPFLILKGRCSQDCLFMGGSQPAVSSLIWGETIKQISSVLCM